MNLLRDKCSNFIRGNKHRLLVLPIYILGVIVFDLVLGLCIPDLWDRLVASSKKTS